MTPHDFIFISYDEPEADKNWELVKKRVPHAKRVHGVDGIARAWKRASEIAESSHFFTMDGDSQINPEFSFEVQDFSGPEDKRVHVYRCRNRVNGLVYGYGSIHLFNTNLVRNFTNLDVVDFTLSVATEGFYIQPEVASMTCFNTSPYIAWKSGFREASKLASKTNAYVGTSVDHRTMGRLRVWTSLGKDQPFGDFCLLGARMGAIFGFKNESDPEKLALISNHEWFQSEFQKIEGCNLEEALVKTGEELNTFGEICQDMTAEQSSLVKKVLYNV